MRDHGHFCQHCLKPGRAEPHRRQSLPMRSGTMRPPCQHIPAGPEQASQAGAPADCSHVRARHPGPGADASMQGQQAGSGAQAGTVEGSTPMWASQPRSSQPSSQGRSRAEQKNSYMAHRRVRASRLHRRRAAAGPSSPSPAAPGWAC